MTGMLTEKLMLTKRLEVFRGVLILRQSIDVSLLTINQTQKSPSGDLHFGLSIVAVLSILLLCEFAAVSD